jgi:GNAT superfamily N-acetyltransferase
VGDVRVGVSGDPRPAAATVLACLLGIRIAVAVAWQRACSGDWGRLRRQGCAAPEVRQRYPSCPELNGLEVWPAELRSQGIGTAIVRTAEDLARQRGYHQLGLGVDDHNHRAAALYLRLGYQETGCHYLDRYHYIDDNGMRHEVADPARYLVKPL